MEMDYSRPGVSYALGMVLGRLYQRDLTIARRIENDELRDARSREIERDLRDPALDPAAGPARTRPWRRRATPRR